VDLWEFYERVETLIATLRTAGLAASADEVEVAMRGGATSGEILGRLGLALPAARAAAQAGAPEEAAEIDELVGYVTETLGQG
jgi:hypothetical protein